MEILSPASNMKHIQIAIDGSANAVYGGLKKWNARNKAINFNDEEYNLLIDMLHQNNIKFFLTLNILMLDNEIDEVIRFLKNNKLPDAFIVTDLGLSKELRKTFPNIPLHFSTQFGAHSVDDVNYIKSINGERAILARELTLDEINNIKNNTDIELECFIWGSQCLSFSGLCFFGTLINGGGGNRGKCIITCRDIYNVNNAKGHHLYVPDMDAINLINRLNNIDCVKLEGRRRNPNEISSVLNNIVNHIKSKKNTGYLFGTSLMENKLYEKINARINPFMNASDLENINSDDICIKYLDDIPYEFSTDYNDPNVKYVYTEIKKSYNINKKNLSFDLTIENNIIKEVLYMNYRGSGHTFLIDDNNLIEFNIDDFINDIEFKNNDINVYKIKYKRSNSNILKINKHKYEELTNYILNDCVSKKYISVKNDIMFKKIYLETNDINVVDEFINDEFVKIIYDIATVNNLKNINSVVKKYDDKIIYKLPLFNWKSEVLSPFLRLLENKEIMFTRFTQIDLCKNINFKKKYTDYTVYIWNKKTLAYLKDNGINEFTISPELSYQTNKNIFENEHIQAVIAGKLPLVYTRNCFEHLFNCKNCKKNQCIKKNIKNEDKNLDFEIFCNDDYRYILNKQPMLNDYSKVVTTDNTNFRYVTFGQDLEVIKESINCFKKSNYYSNLKNNDFWLNSYECNLLEGRE